MDILSLKQFFFTVYSEKKYVLYYVYTYFFFEKESASSVELDDSSVVYSSNIIFIASTEQHFQGFKVINIFEGTNYKLQIKIVVQVPLIAVGNLTPSGD